MPTVYVRKGESLDAAVQRFNERYNNERISSDYEKQSVFISDNQARRAKQHKQWKRRTRKNKHAQYKKY